MTISGQHTTLCFVIKDNKLLLLERADTWFENKKYLPPGGNVDEGEDPRLSATRELAEETGLKVEVEDLKLIWEYENEVNGKSYHNHYYVVTDYSGTVKNNEPRRHTDVGWFALDQLPENTSQIVYDTLERI